MIEKALVNSPDLNISRDNVGIAKERTNQAKADYLPQVDLYGGAGLTGINAVGGRESGELITGKLTASQLIYDFGKTGGSIDYYTQETNASFASYSQEIANKIYTIKRDYYDLLRKTSLIEVYKENITLTEQQLERASRYFQAGIRTKIDVVDARVRLIEAQLDYENATYDVKLAYVQLDKSIGNIYETVEGKVYIPDLNISNNLYDSLPRESMSLEQMEAFAYAHRYELKNFEQKIKSARSNVRREKGGYYPGLYLGGDYQYSSVEDALQGYIPQQQWNANVNLKWNLFGGLRTLARTEEAKIALLQARSAYDETKLRIRQETSSAKINLLKSEANVKLSEALSRAAKEKFGQAQRRYENGLSDYIELEEARQSYISANATLVSYYYDYYIVLAALERAIGR
ncbi:TolC family protein [Sulfurimonas sp. HSL3-7]|uniref:TolC family protein n=1 Tax=Sulfonitrofixus jiaomeiensis TaxID=3131938 RepID=UPI0031F79997